MSNVIKANGPLALPAIFKSQMHGLKEALSEFSGGVTSGFPILSYRGKVWRVRKGGEEINYVNADGDAVPSVELVLVKSNPLPSKIFYTSKYEEGSNEAPACWSGNGISPDAGVTNPVAKTCAACPKNAWGSRITDQGKKARACSDNRRVAVAFAHELEEKGKEASLYLLRIPPASLNPLKDYAEKVLAPKGVPPFAVVTRVGFDAAASHPQLTFRAAKVVTDEQAEAILELRDSDAVRRILAEAAELAPAEPTADLFDEPAPVAAKPTPPPVRKPVVVEEVLEEDEEEEAPPPPKAKKKAAPRPAEVEDVAPTKAVAKDDFDAMLDSILN